MIKCGDPISNFSSQNLIFSSSSPSNQFEFGQVIQVQCSPAYEWLDGAIFKSMNCTSTGKLTLVQDCEGFSFLINNPSIGLILRSL